MTTLEDIERRRIFEMGRRQGRMETLDLICDGTPAPDKAGRRALLLAVSLECLSVIRLKQSDLARIFKVSRAAVNDHLNNLRAKLAQIKGD